MTKQEMRKQCHTCFRILTDLEHYIADTPNNKMDQSGAVRQLKRLHDFIDKLNHEGVKE